MSRFFKKSNSTAEMSFLGHLEALRWHLFRSVIAIIVFAVAAFINKEFIFDTIMFGPKHADFPTYRALCWLSEKFSLDMCIKDFPFTIMSIEMSGQFTMHMWVAFISGLVVGFPYLLWEIWRFVKPALTAKEKQYSTGIVFELPIVIYFLTKIGIVTPKFLRTFRRHAIVVILIVAAVITPSPDVTSQILVAIPLYLLYEISIFVSVMVVKKNKL